MAADSKTLKYIIEFDATYSEKLANDLNKMKKAVADVDGSMSKTSVTSKTLSDNFSRLAGRALLTIPIWLALRTVYLGFVNTLKGGIQYIIDFDKAMAKMTAVTQGVSNIPKFMKQVGEEAQRLMVETGKSITEVTDAYYRFAETGVKAEAALAGMNTTMKLSVATFSDTEEVGRMLIDLYNMFGSSITEATGAQDKLNYIAGLFTVLWKENAGNLGEYINALKNFGSVAKAWNLDLKETLTLTTVLHNFMQRGGIAGTQMARAFQELSKNVKQVELYLGKPIRGQNVDYFQILLEVVGKLNAEMASGKDVSQTVMSIFGERSQKGVLGLASGLQKFYEVWNKVKGLSLEEAMKVLNREFQRQTDTIQTQIDRMGRLRDMLGASFVQGLTGATDYHEALKKINDYIETTLIPTVRELAQVLHDVATNPIVQLLATGIAVKAGVGLAARHPVGMAITTGVLGQAYWNKKQEDATKAALAKYTAAGSEGLSYPEAVQKQMPSWFTSMMKIINPKWTAAGAINMKGVQGTDKYQAWEAGADKYNASKQKSVDLGTVEVTQSKEVLSTYEQMAKILKDSSSLLEYQIASKQKLAAIGMQEYEIELAKLQVMVEQGEKQDKIGQQAQKVMESLDAQFTKFAGQLENSFEGAMSGLLKGESTFADFIAQFKTGWSDAFAEAFSANITDVISSTGLFSMGGNMLMQARDAGSGLKGQIRSAFQSGGMVANQQIIMAFNQGGVFAARQIQVALQGGTPEEAGTMGGGLSVGPGGVNLGNGGLGAFTLPGFGKGGFIGRGMYRTKAGEGAAPTWGQGMNLAATTAMGFASSSSQGGIGGGIMGGLGALGMGIGALQTTAAGSIFSVGAAAGGAGAAGLLGSALIPGIGLALALGAMIWSATQKSKSTQVAEQTQTKQVTSRIDVTNKKLDLVNRNLVGLRQDLTYILPESSYFSEKTNLEDEFSVNSRRGA